MNKRTLRLAYLPPLDPASDFAAVCREMAESGITHIVLQEVCGTIDLKASDAGERVGRVLAECGLKALACHGLEHAPYLLYKPDREERRNMVAAQREMMLRAAALGARTYVLHLGDYPGDLGREKVWGPVALALDELAPAAGAAGVDLALENSFRDTYLARNAAELAGFVERYNHPAVGVCYDVGHAHMYEGAVATLEVLRPYVVTMHLHDNDGRQDWHRIPGRGTVDWAAFVPHIAACPRLRHLETEAIKPELGGTLATTEQHPPAAVYALYRRLLNVPASGLHVPA